MSADDLKNFLDALDTVKNDFICGVCKKTCKEPVVLRKCFHWICGEHKNLKQCPNCFIALDDAETFVDEKITRCIEYTTELDRIFEKVRPKNTTKPTNQTAKKIDEVSTKEVKPSSSKSSSKKPLTDKTNSRPDFSETLNSTVSAFKRNKETRNTKGEKKIDEVSTKEVKPSSSKSSSKKPLTDKTNSRPDFSETLNSTVSAFKRNKETRNTKGEKKIDEVSTKEVKPSSSKSSSKKPKTDKTNSRPDFSETLNSTVSSFKRNKEKRNTKGETTLHLACRLGKIAQIKELLSSGANTNTKDNAGWTPLHEVVQNGKLKLVELLLQYNTLINVPGQSNETPLHEAVRYNHGEIAEVLVKHGADMNARNCKGETPYQLASSDMKNRLLAAADNLLQTQGVNVSSIAAACEEVGLEDIHIYCVSQYRSVHNKLKALAKHHDNVFVEAKFTKKVTHMVVDAENGVCECSLDVLQGIVSSVWIISTEWVTKSADDKLESFNVYEITGVGAKSYKGPKTSRYNKYKQLPGLFNGCHFYLHNFNTVYEISKSLIFNKTILTKLITDAGGIVLRRVPNPESIPESEQLVPYHAKKDSKLYNCSHYIIFKDLYEPMYNMQHIKALPIGWLIECIEKYELCESW